MALTLDALATSSSWPELVRPVPPAYRENARELLELLARLDESLDVLWGPRSYRVRVESGYRPPELNRAVGGSETSLHLRAAAADISIVGPHGGLAPESVYAFALARLPELYSGRLELLRSGTSIHVGLEEPPVWSPDGWAETRRAELPELAAWGFAFGLLLELLDR